MLKKKAKSQDEILMAWSDEIIRLSEKRLYATVPPLVFENLKSMNLVEGTYDACVASGMAYSKLIERRTGGTRSKKRAR